MLRYEDWKKGCEANREAWAASTEKSIDKHLKGTSSLPTSIRIRTPDRGWAEALLSSYQAEWDCRFTDLATVDGTESTIEFVGPAKPDARQFDANGQQPDVAAAVTEVLLSWGAQPAWSEGVVCEDEDATVAADPRTAAIDTAPSVQRASRITKQAIRDLVGDDSEDAPDQTPHRLEQAFEARRDVVSCTIGRSATSPALVVTFDFHDLIPEDAQERFIAEFRRHISAMGASVMNELTAPLLEPLLARETP